MKKMLITLCTLLCLCTACSSQPEKQEEVQHEQPKAEKREVSLTFTGDILIEDPLYVWMSDYQTKDTYSFKNYFDKIKPLLDGDVCIGNQEVPIAGREYGITGINFMFNAPEEIAPQLSKLGFDVLTFANNHSFDRGFAGIEKTIDALNNAGIKTTGAFKEEHHEPLIIEKNGIRIAILAYTYDTNQWIDENHKYAVNKFLNANHEFDEEHQAMIKADVEKAKAVSDVTIAAMHWGTEFTYQISKAQQQAAQFLNDCGVDIIVGNHPHTLQGVDTLTNKEGKETFVMYSLGNLVSSAAAVSRASEQFQNMYEVGGIVHLDVVFDPNTKQVEIKNQKLHAIVNHFTYGYDQYELIPFKDYNEELAAQHYQRACSMYFTYDYLKQNLASLFDGKIDWE